MAPSNATEQSAIQSSTMPSNGPDVQESHRQETHDANHAMTQQSMAQQQMPWTTTTANFAQDDIGQFGGFDYEQLVLDPAFNFPDFFNFAPQILS